MKFLLVMLVLLFTTGAQAEVTINWWHSMEGDLGDNLDKLVAKYNASQKSIKMVPTYRGNYTESLNASIAAYRGGKQPHIVQVFEVGTQTMMSSNVIYPVQDLMNDQGIKINWEDLLDPVRSYYQEKGKLMSMPFNSSTALLYYNSDWLKKAKVGIPKTWNEVKEASQKIVKAGAKCGFVAAWQQWTLVENFSAIHDFPFASNQNGFGGLDTKVAFNNPKVKSLVQMLKDMMNDKSFRYEGRRSDPSKKLFLNGDCGFYMDSTSQIGTLKKLAKFNWGATYMPVLADMSAPKNSIIGGATLWVFKGHKTEEYKGVADFFNFLNKAENQIWWHQNTGYLPLTKTAYEQLKKDGYYKKEPFQEIAVLQLMRTTPTENSKGIRLGNYSQIRDIIDEEFEKIWAGSSTVDQALSSAADRSNRTLEQYKRTIR